MAMDRELTPAERRALKTHVAICRSCRTFRNQLERLREFLRAPETPRLPTSFLADTLSPTARARIRAAIAAHDDPDA